MNKNERGKEERTKNLKMFSSEYQPSPAAKSRGWSARAAKRKAEKKIYEAQVELLLGKETSAKRVDGVSTLFGKPAGSIKHIHTLLARLYMSAMEGNVAAAQKLLNFDYLSEENDEGTDITIKITDE